MSTYTEHVADLRQQITERQDERARLAAQPHDRATVAAVVKRTVLHWHDEGKAHVDRQLSTIAAGSAHALLTIHGLVAPSTAPVPQPFALNLGPLFVALLGSDAVEAALLRFVDEIPGGMPVHERNARLAEIDAELDRLELDEETTIVRAGREGESIQRRRDARPDVICRVIDDGVRS